MRDDLQQTLYDTFPDLYWQHTLPMEESCMYAGITCDDGWYDIIYKLSEAITAIIAKDPELDPKTYSVCQVKEKLGGLRFYILRWNDDIHKAIHAAERESFKTCERCGKPGELRTTGWLRTLCDECEEARQARQAERRRRANRHFPLFSSFHFFKFWRAE